MNIHARYGFPRIRWPLAALALLLAGCKTEWDRWDDEYLRSGYSKKETLANEQTITRFRPGQTTAAEIERAIGPFVEEKAPHLFEDGSRRRRWRDDWRGWGFTFTKDGVLQSFSRCWHGNMGTFESQEEYEEFHRWYLDRLAFLPVPDERLSEFVPGRTTQEQVLDAWGVCQSAELRDGGHFVLRWGSPGNLWTLPFDRSGVLAGSPEHYLSGVPGP